MIDAARLDSLTGRSWPGLTNVDIDGWLVRAADGFTQRANSVLPLHEPADPDAAIDQVRELYTRWGLPPTFYISDGARPADLDARLEKRGYVHRAPTLILATDLDTLLNRLRPSQTPVEIGESPGNEWLHAWWDIDRDDPRERYLETARRVLTASPALYGQIARGDGVGSPRAVARMALVEEWAGLACLAVHPEFQGNGDSNALIGALGRAARMAGARRVWLQVRTDNETALRLYYRLGFTTVGRYHYRGLREG